MQSVHEQVPRGFKALAVPCLFDEPFDRLVTVGFRHETHSRLGDGKQLRWRPLATHLTAGRPGAPLRAKTKNSKPPTSVPTANQ
jgi:hypothetical protein